MNLYMFCLIFKNVIMNYNTYYPFLSSENPLCTTFARGKAIRAEKERIKPENKESLYLIKPCEMNTFPSGETLYLL